MSPTSTYDYESFWARRKRVKNVGTYDSADAIIEAACEYFRWVHDHPLQEEVLFHYKGVVTSHNSGKLRAFTKHGLCMFLGVKTEDFHNWRAKEELKDAVEFIENVIYTQKFEGAAAGLLNPNLISRDLGLAERRELTGADGGPIETKEMSARDILAERLAAIAPREPSDGDAGDADG